MAVDITICGRCITEGGTDIADQEEVRIVRVYEIHIVGSERELDGIFLNAHLSIYVLSRIDVFPGNVYESKSRKVCAPNDFRDLQRLFQSLRQYPGMYTDKRV